MAKVWFARRGPDGTRGPPFAELPLSQCAELLGLDQANWKKPLEDTPKFDVDAKLAMFAAPQFVVIEVEQGEADQHQWRSGFYLLSISPADAKERIETEYR